MLLEDKEEAGTLMLWLLINHGKVSKAVLRCADVNVLGPDRITGNNDFRKLLLELRPR